MATLVTNNPSPLVNGSTCLVCPEPLRVHDITTGQDLTPVNRGPSSSANITTDNSYANITTDSLAIEASSPSWWIRGGSGDDYISVTSGRNVLNGSTGSNFLVGGTGTDSFWVDAGGLTTDSWSTV